MRHLLCCCLLGWIACSGVHASTDRGGLRQSISGLDEKTLREAWQPWIPQPIKRLLPGNSNEQWMPRALDPGTQVGVDVASPWRGMERGRVVDVGDIDGDQLPDLLMLQDDLKLVMLLQTKNAGFQVPHDSGVISPVDAVLADTSAVNVFNLSKNATNYAVEGALIADFNGDGLPDIFVVLVVNKAKATATEAAEEIAKETNLVDTSAAEFADWKYPMLWAIFTQSRTGGGDEFALAWSSLGSSLGARCSSLFQDSSFVWRVSLSYPLVVDMDLDGSLDVVTQSLPADDGSSIRLVWRNNGDAKFSCTLFEDVVVGASRVQVSPRADSSETAVVTASPAFAEGIRRDDHPPAENSSEPAEVTDRTRRMSWWNPFSWFHRDKKEPTSSQYKSKNLDDVLSHPSVTLNPLPTSLTWAEDLSTVRREGVIARVHSSGLVDLNGDCRSDLVIEVSAEGQDHSGSWRRWRELELYLNRGRKYHRLPGRPGQWSLPPGASLATWTDVDGNGRADLLFAICDTGTLRNQKEHPAPSWLHQYRLSKFPQCTGGDMIAWALMGEGSPSPPTATTTTQLTSSDTINRLREWWHALIRQFHVAGGTGTREQCRAAPVVLEDFHSSSLPPDCHFNSLGRPLTLRAGDADADGFNDVLAPVVAKDRSPRVVLFANGVGTVSPTTTPPPPQTETYAERVKSFLKKLFGSTSETSGEEKIRSFYPSQDFLLRFKNNTESMAETEAAFIDITGNGSLNVLAFAQFAKVPPVIFQRGPLDHANFICAMAIAPSASRRSNYTVGLFGHRQQEMRSSKDASAYFGATFAVAMTNLEGDSVVRSGVLKGQTTYSFASLPAVYMGLGSSTNYVDHLTLGLPDETTGWRRSWTNLIPNTFVVVDPYQKNPQDWLLHLSVPPGTSFLPTLLVSIAAIAFTSGVIVWLDRKRDRHELLERAGFQQHFIQA